jgi:hypothetical protein
MCGIIAMLLLGLNPGAASAQTEVKGSGTTHFSNGSTGVLNFEHIEVNAWLDADGTPHGKITWEGDVFFVLPDGTGFHGGPADPFQIQVDTFVVIDATTVFVGGVVVGSSNKSDIGGSAGFYFTDGAGSGPDEIDFSPIDAGNIIIW